MVVFHGMENFSASFPQYGKLLVIFSTLWKTFSRFFHSMENFFEVFPQYGKLYPHGRIAECRAQADRRRANARSIADRLAIRASEVLRTERQNGLKKPVFSGFRAVGSGLWSGARGAPCEP